MLNEWKRGIIDDGKWNKKILKSKTGFPIELGMTEENKKRELEVRWRMEDGVKQFKIKK